LLDSAKGKLSGAAGSAGRLATKLKSVAAAYVGFHTVKGIVSSSIQLAADAEQTSVAFRVLLGDAGKAAEMMNQLQSFAASTPFQLTELQNAARLLVAFGFSSQQAMEQLRVLGNIAAGTNQPIGELAELLGKARVQGTIFSEDLNQLTGRGINVLDGLAARLGTTSDQVKKFASEGKVSFNDLNAVITELSQKNFGGLMAEQSKTIAGQWSSIKDDVAQIGRDIGGLMIPQLKKLTESSYWRNFSAGLSMMRGGESAFDDLAKKEQRIMEEEQFRKRQLANKDAIRADRQRATQNGGAIGKAVGGALENMLSGGASALSGLSGIGESLAQLESAFVQTSWQTTDAIVKSQKESPAIKSMEAGTQEAYEFLTGAARKQQEEDAAKAKREEEMAKRQEKTNNLIETFTDILRQQGWGAI
jgi:tape measure domain-containing protein